MRDKSVSCWSEGQSPLDLSGCSFAPIPGTGIRLCHPTGYVAERLGKGFGISSRMAHLLTVARTNIGDREIFLQDYRLIGYAPNGNPIHLIITILTTARYWRGGWFLASVPPEEADVFKRHVESARAASVEELRTERRQHGSKN
jgi:hypothetical protein